MIQTSRDLSCFEPTEAIDPLADGPIRKRLRRIETRKPDLDHVPTIGTHPGGGVNTSPVNVLRCCIRSQ